MYTLDTHVQSRNCHGLSERDAQKETYLVPWFVVGVRKVFGQKRIFFFTEKLLINLLKMIGEKKGVVQLRTFDTAGDYTGVRADTG